ncbi:MAG: N-acyl-D-glucosamine 2-epimerase-like protein [Devosia sp.]|nr:N-acyl-D-glucosamine 2-epimerase-like protein [Devosia sp.]
MKPPIPTDYPEIANYYREILIEHVIEPWFPRSIDFEFGGFLCDFDVDWQPSGSQHKVLEFQARQTLVAAELSMAFPSNPHLKAATERGFEALSGPLWDRAYGGWFIETDRAGQPLDQIYKHAHGMTYAVEACSAVYAASGSESARLLALEGFDWLQANAHDPVHGGYFGALARDGTAQMADSARAGTRDRVGTPLGLKDMDVNKDAVEFLCFAAAVHPEVGAIQRARDSQLDIVRRLISADHDALSFYFRPDWTPVPGYWRPSEAIHGAAMLLEGRRSGTGGSIGAIAEVLHKCFAAGWSKRAGGLRFEAHTGRTKWRELRRDAPWWAQFELLRVAEYLHRLLPGDPAVLPILAAARGAAFSLIDYESKGIYTTPLRALRPGARLFKNRRFRAATTKGSVWKDASHDGRVLLRLASLPRWPIVSGPPRINLEPGGSVAV